MVSERRIFCFRLRYPYTVGISFEEKYRLMQDRKKEIKVIMKDTLLYLHNWYPVYLPTTAAAELAYLILDFFLMNLIYYNYAL